MVNLIMLKGQKLNNLGTFILHDFQEIYARFGPAAVSAGVYGPPKGRQKK